MTRWPRMMKLATAAQFCDLSASAFLSEVARGRLPSPVTLGGRDHWSQFALDRALARLTGEEPLPEWEAEFEKRYG